MDHPHVFGDLTFTRQLIPSFGLSAYTGYFTHQSDYFQDDQIRIHLSDVDEITQQHIDLLKMIRRNFPSILELCMAKLLTFTGRPGDVKSIRGKLTSPTILFSHDMGDPDRQSWAFEVVHDHDEIHISFTGLRCQRIWDFWDNVCYA